MEERLKEIDRYKNYTLAELYCMEDFYKLFDFIDNDETLEAAVFKTIIKAQRYKMKKIFKFMQKIDKLTFLC